MMHVATKHMRDQGAWLNWLGGVAATLLLGCALALTGLPGVYALLALLVAVPFAAVAARYPGAVTFAAIWMLGLCPFIWGLQTGVLPKLFGDEVVLLLYALTFPVLLLLGKRLWHPGGARAYVGLAAFLVAESLSFAVSVRDLVAFRNFLETYVLGVLLFVLFFQEASAEAIETPAESAIVWLTLVIAALSVVERVTQHNPVMEHVDAITYLSPEIARITEGVYRPYVSFFHPSETGTFMALGAPFVIAWSRRRGTMARVGLLSVLGAGFMVNATRGVWVAVAVVILLIFPRIWKVLLFLLPATAVACGIGYTVLKGTPFMERLTDPANLFARFEYWRMAVQITAAHPVLGVGHMQFKEFYMDYVQDLSTIAHFDVKQVFVADNMYLTTVVEHGLVGLLALLSLLVSLSLSLRKMRAGLLAHGRATTAAFVQNAQLALIAYAVTGCFADVHLFTKATKYLFLMAGIALGAGSRVLRAPVDGELLGCAVAGDL